MVLYCVTFSCQTQELLVVQSHASPGERGGPGPDYTRGGISELGCSW